MLYDEKVTVIWISQLAGTKWILPLDFNKVLWDNNLTAAFSKWLKKKWRTWRNGHKYSMTLIKPVLEQLLPARGWGRLPAGGRQHGGLLFPVCGPLMEPAEIQQLPSPLPTSPKTGEAVRWLITGFVHSLHTLSKEPQRENKCLARKRVQLQITLPAGCRNLGSFVVGSPSGAEPVLLGTGRQSLVVP